jgi:hypothetical protein
MRYLYAGISAVVLLALWGRFGEGLSPMQNAALLAAFLVVLWRISRRPKP